MSEERKAPCWENEEWTLRLPDLNQVACKDCFLNWFELPDGKINKGGQYGRCQVYGNKPHGILFENDSCPYYISENE